MNYYYECVNCKTKYFQEDVIYLCPKCEKENNLNNPPKGVLKVYYDYDELKNKSFREIEENNYLDLLPINDENNLPKLRVGKTPLYKIEKERNGKTYPFQVFIKDESQNPTFSFKDRASYVVSAFAKENKIDKIVAASTGNAGSSLAGICASQGQKAIIMVPETAPLSKLTQILMYGATLVPVHGNYDDAFDMSVEATKKYGWYNRNTAFNPFTIEGKKTASYEIFSQSNGILPTKIFVPVGDGCIISGIYKGFEDLLRLNFIKEIPTIIAVQSSKSCNIVRNYKEEIFKIYPSSTIADSISVDIPRNFYMTKEYLKKYSGEAVEVEDSEIISSSKYFAENTGVFAEPAASAAGAGFIKYWKEGKIKKDDSCLVLLTGSGLKDLSAVQTIINMPKSYNKNDIDKLKNLTNY